MSDKMQDLGKYQLIEKIGEGGFGVVYRARDPLLEREVAIKVPDAAFLQQRYSFTYAVDYRLIQFFSAVSVLSWAGWLAAHFVGDKRR